MLLTNPFVVYVLSFGATLLLYQLHWSELYPHISLSLAVFFLSTFAAAIFLASLLSPSVTRPTKYQPGLLPSFCIWIVVGTFLVEIVNMGQVPLWLVIKGRNFYQLEAGASHLHAFTFWSAFSVIRFADFLYSKRRRYLLEASATPIFYILFVYRGPFIMCFTSWCFVWLIWTGRGLSLRRMLLVGCAGLGILYLNGVLGDIRSPGQELAGRPSAAFKESGVPRTFFWAYLYLTAPMANLQLTVDTASAGHGSVPEFVASELLPDFLAKRILPRLDPQITGSPANLTTRDLLYSWDQPQISDGLNIATLFARSYGYFGWIGPPLMFLILSAFILVYLMMTRETIYQVPCLALLNTLVVFCLFNNMLASTAMIPQLAWPLLLLPWRTQRKLQEPSRCSLADTASR
jgi:hypothetical protein